MKFQIQLVYPIMYTNPVQYIKKCIRQNQSIRKSMNMIDMSGDGESTTAFNYEVFDLEAEVVSNLAFNSLLFPTVLFVAIFFKLSSKMCKKINTVINQQRNPRSPMFYSDV